MLIFHPQLWRSIFFPLLAILLYLSFKPNPAIQDVPWIPHAAAEQFDLNDQWKNFVGFMAMGFTGFLAWPAGVGPVLLSLTWRRVLLAMLLCGAIVVIELIQIPIPTRWCDEKDILAGSLGVCLSWPLAVASRWGVENYGFKRST